MKRNRILAWLLSAALALSLVVLPASAAYVDVTEIWDWAAEAIDDMTERGLFVGVGGGRFNPGGQLTASQALTLAARICADLETRQKIGLARREEVSTLLGDANYWWWDEAATCLETGVITYAELHTLQEAGALNRPITMEDFSFYMVRAMQLEPMAKRLTSYTLSFKDADQVAQARRPYVYILNLYGLARGDQNQNFSPKSNVNRARSATLISRMLSFMEERGITVELPEYTDYAWTAGSIAGVTTGDQGAILLSLEGADGETRVITCQPDIAIYQNNMRTEAGSLRTGSYARVCYDKEGKPFAIRLSGALETTSGSVSAFSSQQVAVVTGGVERYFDLNRFTTVQIGEEVGDRTLIDPDADYISAVCKVDDLGDLVYLRLEGGTRQEVGLIGAVETIPDGGYRLSVKSFDGVARQYTVPAGAAITANNVVAGTLNSSYVGSYISMRVSNQNDEAVNVAIDTVSNYVQGAITNIRTTNGESTVTISDVNGVRSGTYKVSPDVAVTYAGTAVKWEEVQQSWFATARISNGFVVQLNAYPGSVVTTGTVSGAVEFGSDGSVVLHVLQENGTTVDFTMDVNALPTIKRSGSNSSIDRIRSGDSVVVTIRYNKIDQIDTVPQSANVTGVIQRKVEELAGTSLELLLDDGTTADYLIGNGTSITQDGRAVTLASLRVGYRVSLVVNSGEVYTVQVEKSTTSATELSGTVLYVNATERTVLFQTAEGSAPITVSVPVNTVILDVTTGRTLTLRSLESGDVLQITGSYDGLNFKAVTVLRK